MIQPALKRYYQDVAIAEAYDRDRFSGIVGGTFDGLEQQAIDAVLTRVRRSICAPSVLDVPCGTGRITELLLDSGLSVTGGDISTAMLAVAERKCARFGSRARWRQLDLDRLEAHADAFDLVTCIRLFHHLDSSARGRTLQELARVARRFVMVNVAYSSPLYRLRRRAKRALGQDVSRTSSTWAEILAESEAAGLRVEAFRFVCPLLSEDLVVLFRKR